MAPIAGAMVVLLNDDERPVSRVITAADGDYRVVVQVPARYRLRVDRIGYASTLTAPFDVAAGSTVRVDVTTTVQPVELPSVEAHVGRQCEVRPAEGVATNRVWEEARKALEAARWTAERGLYQFSGMRFEREFAANGRRILSDRQTRVRQYTDQPYKAANAADLIRYGFVRRTGEALTYFGPDASVLLSDAFLDTHCFALDEKREDGAVLIGLRFEPVPGRDLPEVEGVLWLDESARLRSIEYRYVNLSARLGGDDASGELTFRGLPNGTWIVQAWRIRMPRLGAQRNEHGDTVRYRVIGFRDEGGAVELVATARGEVVAGGAAGAVLRGIVLDSIGRPAAGARVSVLGTVHDAVTGADGAFRFPDLGEGTWAVAASHAALVAVGHTGVAIEIELGNDEERRVELELPSVRSVVLDRCGGTRPGSGEAMLVGRVVDANGAPRSGADVHVLWIRVGLLPGGGTSQREEGLGLETEQDGTYVGCQVPAGHRLRISASTGGLASDTVEVRADTAVVAAPELRLRSLAADRDPGAKRRRTPRDRPAPRGRPACAPHVTLP